MPIKTIDGAALRHRFPAPKGDAKPPDLRGRVEIHGRAAPAVMAFTLPVPPSVNNLYFTTKEGKRVKTAEGRAYAKVVWQKLSFLTLQPFHGQVGIRVHVFRKIRRGDLDNYSKALFDSLKGICWLDDEQIVHIEAKRFEDKANPRVEVEVWEVKP